MCDQGHAVIFLPEEYGDSAIIDLEDGTVDYMREEDGNYMMDVWVPSPSMGLDAVPPEEGFGRQR